MANILSAKAEYIKFLVRDIYQNSGELNISKMYIHQAEVNEPFVEDVTTLVDDLELVASSFRISETKVAVHSEQSLQTPFQFNRCYLTNSTDTILYIFDIEAELQSEIDIDFMIHLEDLIELVN